MWAVQEKYISSIFYITKYSVFKNDSLFWKIVIFFPLEHFKKC